MSGTTFPKKLTPEIEKDMVKYFDYLAARWEDEQEYEDIRDYVAAFEEKFKVKVLKFKTEPLAFSFRYGDHLCAVLATAHEIKFNRVLAPTRTPPRTRKKATA